jgi:hypothetical protein
MGPDRLVGVGLLPLGISVYSIAVVLNNVILSKLFILGCDCLPGYITHYCGVGLGLNIYR